MNIQLGFANGGTALSVRSFCIRESISELFRIELTARTANANLDFEELIGQAATVSLNDTTGVARQLVGICVQCEQLRVETTGLSTYELVIVPQLWLMGKRRNYRLFQHVSVVEIATSMLAEWQIEHRLALTSSYAPLELRIQYGESDYEFLSRLLQEAGIAFWFEYDAEAGMRVVLGDEPHAAGLRDRPLLFVDQVEQAQRATIDYATNVRVRREMRTGRIRLRDFDFRRPRYELSAQAVASQKSEAMLEDYQYVPGAFVTEGHRASDTPTADDLGVARADESAGSNLAKRLLEAERGRRRLVSLETNVYGVCPATTFVVAGHPRNELGVESKLLATHFELRGNVAEPDEWHAQVEAVFTDTPYRPAIVTPKPRISGVQSAIVVGPERETVYSDEFGRVRVQFHWDRQGEFDSNSSCWMRVSQAWAGPGYGLFNLPRVGHEVLVGFVDGDPDQPVIVGRVFNGAQQVPYPLPGSKLMSGWKTDSNSNIILFDDTPGDEMFYTQAEQDKLNIVKRYEANLHGASRTTYVGTTDKTLVRTMSDRVAIGSHTTLAGITNTHIGTIGFKAHAGLNAEMKAGNKVLHVVQPVVPFIQALMSINDKEAAILNKLPGGKAPDLKQVLPAKAGGPSPIQAAEPPIPPATLDETKAELERTLAVVGQALTQFEPEEVETIALENGLEGAVDAMLRSLHARGGDEAVLALTSAQQLGQKLQELEQQAEKAPTAEAKKQTAPKKQLNKQSGMFEQLLVAILALVLPKTRIEIKHQKITIATEKASIELDKGDIKLKAQGDISIEADGKVSIKGCSIETSPPL
jgi:type VI secretion system secreted protein VgrG